MKLLRYISLSLLSLLALTLSAQSESRWAVQANIGQTSVESGGSYEVSNNEGNLFSLKGDYFLTSHLALSGGGYLEQNGLFTNYDSGIGLIRYNMTGLQGGAKYYLCPRKWVIQPYVEASLLTNVLHWGHSQGKKQCMLSEGVTGMSTVDYEFHCPALTLSPAIGIDIRLISSLSLNISADYRWGLYGKQTATLTLLSGPHQGSTYTIQDHSRRTAISGGLRMNFPTHKVSDRGRNNLILLLFNWLSSKKA